MNFVKNEISPSENEEDPGAIKQRIIRLLKLDKRRDIYEAAWGKEFWICHGGGGPFPRGVVWDMFKAGTLKRKYPEGECYVLSDNQ